MTSSPFASTSEGPLASSQEAEVGTISTASASEPQHGGSVKGLMRRVRRNVGVLLSGSAMSQGIGFLSVAVNARALGADGLGTIALLQAFSGLIGRIFAFDTWQPVMKLGAGALQAGDMKELAKIVSLGFAYDAAAGLLSIVVAGLVIVFFGPVFGISGGLISLALFWCLITLGTAVLGGAGAAVGVLRLLNGFAWLSGVQVVQAATLLVISLVLWGLGAGLGSYVVSFALLSCAAQLAIVSVAILKLHRRGVRLVWPDLRPSSTRLKAFNSFAWSSSATSLINAARLNADTLLLAAFTGPASIGIYSVAKKLAQVLNIIGEAGRHSVFLEVTNLVAAKDAYGLKTLLYHLARVGSAISLAAMLAILLFGPWGLTIGFGAEFADAYVPLILLALSSCFYLIGFAFGGFVQSTAGPGVLAAVFAISFLISTPLGFLAVQRFGLPGAGVGQLVFMFVWFIACLQLIQRHLAKLRSETVIPVAAGIAS